MMPNGRAIPIHLLSISQNLTIHCLPPAAWNAPAVGKVSGLVALNLPQYAIAETETKEIGMP